MIAGGGPAGLACGIRLRELGWEVAIHERRDYPLRKVCGEFLSPVGWSRLESLGAIGHLVAQPPPIARARFEFAPGSAVAFPLAPAARGLSREAMDTALAARFRALGGDLREGSEWTESVEPGEGFVDARGRLVEAGAVETWRGWKGYVDPGDIPAGLGGDLLTMLPVAGGYCGMSLVEDGRLGVCFVSRRKAPPHAILDSHPLLSQLSDRIHPHAAISGFRFHGGRDPRGIGDRLRVWPPLVGDGMSRALGAGIAHAEHMALGLPMPRQEGLDFAVAMILHAAMCSPALRRAADWMPWRRWFLARAYRMTRG
ncbi:MAG TPA: hypothetical protein VN931_09560 [Fibrobacteria bacterium]|nr:hypothetical protein [Fibrobacteria bacterium]